MMILSANPQLQSPLPAKNNPHEKTILVAPTLRSLTNHRNDYVFPD